MNFSLTSARITVDLCILFKILKSTLAACAGCERNEVSFLINKYIPHLLLTLLSEDFLPVLSAKVKAKQQAPQRQ